MTHQSPLERTPRELSPETRERLKGAVLRHWNGGAQGDAELKSALQQAAEEARKAQMRAEDLIVAFKALWDELPLPHDGGASGDEARLRARAISMSIRAYYSD
jgi:hypothetical protein